MTQRELKPAMDDLMKTITAIVTPRPPRVIRQMDLEEQLFSFCPDVLEASELLDALMAGLRNRLRCDQLTVVEEEAKALKVALAEAMPYEPSKEDEAYADWRATKDDKCD